MKKNFIIILIGIIFIFGLGIFFYSQSDFTYLAIIKGSIHSTTSNASLTTFHTTRKDTIVISANSTIEQGSLTITLTDESGAVIKDIDVDTNYSELIQVKKNKDYKLLVSYQDFIGDYEIKCK
ncbi:MAG: hypothetical protein H2184_17250 [Candidatus Galacturonibacter soehngenii]|nr:hypothetical protein [Candidatus Galacturonibacter soehngenii]